MVGEATPVHRARRPHLDAQDVGPATTGKPRHAATTHGLASIGSKTREADASRPDLLGLVATCVARLDFSDLMIVKQEIVFAWHREGFRLFRTWKVRRGKPGRPSVPRRFGT